MINRTELNHDICFVLKNKPKLTNAAIARTYNVSENTVSRLRKKLNLPTSVQLGARRPRIATKHQESTQQRIQRLAKAVRQNPNANITQLSALTKIPKSTISQHVKQNDVPKPQPKTLVQTISPTEIQELIDAYPNASKIQIAQKLDVSLSTFNRMLTKNPSIIYKKKRKDSYNKDVDPVVLQDYVTKYPNKTYAEYAQRFNIQPRRIPKLFKQHRIQIQTLEVEAVRKYIKQYPYKTTTHLATHFGVSKSKMSQFIRDNPALKESYQTKNKLNLTPEKIQKIQAHINQNPEANMFDLAIDLGFSESTISKIIADYNLKYVRKNKTQSSENSV